MPLTTGAGEVLVVAESTVLGVAAHERRSALARQRTVTNAVVGPLVLKSKFISGGKRARKGSATEQRRGGNW